MATYEDVEYETTRLTDLKVWAKAQCIDWTKSNAKHHPWRAAKTIDGEVRLIGVGRTLKMCLWMAHQMLTTR
jgi:hypothetical protein